MKTIFNHLFVVIAVSLFTVTSCGNGVDDDTLTPDKETDPQDEITAGEVEFWMTRGNKCQLLHHRTCFQICSTGIHSHQI